MGRSKARNCVTNQLLPSVVTHFTNGCNTVTCMSLIKNSICPPIDQRPKQCQATHSMKKDFHTTKPAEYATYAY